MALFVARNRSDHPAARHVVEVLRDLGVSLKRPGFRDVALFETELTLEYLERELGEAYWVEPEALFGR